jgi:hypothetical protein
MNNIPPQQQPQPPPQPQQPQPAKKKSRALAITLVITVVLLILIGACTAMLGSSSSPSPTTSYAAPATECKPLAKDQLKAIADGLKPEYGAKITGESAWLPLPAELQTSANTKIAAVGVDLGGGDHDKAIFAINNDVSLIQDVDAVAFALFDWGSDFKDAPEIDQLRESDAASEVADCLGG